MFPFNDFFKLFHKYWPFIFFTQFIHLIIYFHNNFVNTPYSICEYKSNCCTFHY